MEKVIGRQLSRQCSQNDLRVRKKMTLKSKLIQFLEQISLYQDN